MWGKGELDEAACGFQAASSSSPLLQPFPPPSIHLLQSPSAFPTCVVMRRVCWGCWWWCGRWKCGERVGWAIKHSLSRWAFPGLAQMWALARALSGGSGGCAVVVVVWGKNIHVGVLATLMSEFEMTSHIFECCAYWLCLKKRSVHSFLNGFSWKKL